jgi:tRNA-Thr(GGU) m(6)t(6)A37 methyltransferase TsaA
MTDREPRMPSDLPPLRSIGAIRTPFREPAETPVQGALAADTEGTVELDPAYAEGLADVDGYSHLILLYAFDRCPTCRLTVTPYLDDTPRGLFATRAPCRPNPLGLTVVRLLRIEGLRLRVAGVDMLDGTPLLDIKPYVSRLDGPRETASGWLGRRLATLASGEGPPHADGRFHGREPGGGAPTGR